MKKHRAELGAGLFLAGLLLWVASCAINPVSGRQQLMLLSEADEIKLGQQTDAEVVNEYGVYRDPGLTAYLNDLCQRLGRVSHRPHLNYQLKILDASVVNAFAVPGGYVYFSRGILASLNSEAELAGVMGHEIGHITARHSAQQYSRAQLAQVGVGLGTIVSDIVGLPGLGALAQLGTGMLFLRFSRDNEREADSLGVEYASKAGFDASHLASFFATLERMNPGSDRSGLPGWFSTHPSPEDRVQAVRAMSQQWKRQLGSRELKVNQAPYLKQIDGLTYGDDPRQGYVADNIFFHPDLRFQFPVPAKWTLHNTMSQVQIASDTKEAVILFSLASGSAPGEAAKTFVSQTQGSVLRSEAIRTNGLPAQRVISDIRTDEGMLRVISYFIRKENHIFVFHGLSSPKLYQKYETTFVNTMGQFGELTDPRRIHVQPDRIRIHSTPRADTLANTLRSLGVPSAKLKEVALLNGKELNERIPAHALVKVVEKGR